MLKPNSILFIVTLYLVILLKAGNIDWVAFGFSAIVFSIALFFCFSITRQQLKANEYQSEGSFSVSELHKSPFFYLLLFQLWVFIQYSTGITYDYAATLRELILGCAILIFVLFISFLKDKELSIFYISLITMAVFQSLYGIYILLSGNNSILWWPKVHYLEHATGTFVNPNHYAAFLNLAIGLVLSSILHRIHDQNLTHPKSFLRKTFLVFSKIFSIEGFVLAILILGVLCSRSFGAIFTLIGTIGLCSLFLFVSTVRIKLNTILLVAFSLVAGLVFLTSFIDSSVIQSEVSRLSFTFERRTEIITAGMRVVEDFWLLGSGAGSFYTVFPAYRDLEVGNAFYYHAHNDYIEFLSEYGIIGVILLLAFLFYSLKKNLSHIAYKSKNYSQRKVFAYASVFAITSLAIHSIVDFPLQTVAYTLVFLCIISANNIAKPQRTTNRRD